MDRRAFVLGSAGLWVAACSREGQRASVGSKNFTEQLVLGELLAQQLEKQMHTEVEDRKSVV